MSILCNRDKSKGIAVKKQIIYDLYGQHTTIGFKKTIKYGLNRDRAPGQCYDGFVCWFIDLWEKVKEEKQNYVVNPNKREVMPIE